MTRASVNDYAPSVQRVTFSHGLGGYFYDDLAAIQAGAEKDGEFYVGRPVTSGFTAIRMPATTIRISLRLSDGFVVTGDAMSVQYAGAAHRDPVLNPALLSRADRAKLDDGLSGLHSSDLRTALDRAHAVCAEGNLAHRGIGYALSQALTAAAAHAHRRQMAEVIADAYGLKLTAQPVAVYAQSGESRYTAVDRMIAKRVDVIPHGLINNRAVFGEDGERFLEYVRWVKERVEKHGHRDYRPRLHFDVYGLAGQIFGTEAALADFLAQVESAGRPFEVAVESPVIETTRSAQLERMARLRRRLHANGTRIDLVADEWCNTLADIREFAEARACDMVQLKLPDVGWLDESVEAVKVCRSYGIKVFIGGSCTETATSAEYTVHLAVATAANQVLAKPGMGVDEALSLTMSTQSTLLNILDGRCAEGGVPNADRLGGGSAPASRVGG